MTRFLLGTRFGRSRKLCKKKKKIQNGENSLLECVQKYKNVVKLGVLLAVVVVSPVGQFLKLRNPPCPLFFLFFLLRFPNKKKRSDDLRLCNLYETMKPLEHTFNYSYRFWSIDIHTCILYAPPSMSVLFFFSFFRVMSLMPNQEIFPVITEPQMNSLSFLYA